MYDPETCMTEADYEQLKVHVFNVRQAARFFLDRAPDLHIGRMPKDDAPDILIDMQNLFETNHLLHGDGEEQ